jgi:hypothetical protein
MFVTKRGKRGGVPVQDINFRLSVTAAAEKPSNFT